MAAAPVKNRHWMITLLLGAGVLGYMFFLFLPRQRAIGQVRAEIREPRGGPAGVRPHREHRAGRKRGRQSP